MTEWSYKWQLKHCRASNHGPSDSIASVVRSCKNEILSESLPQFFGWLPFIKFAPVLTPEIILVAEESVVSAWERLHLFWRYEALKYAVFLQRQDELIAEKLSGGSKGRLKIGVVDCQMFNALLMTIASAAVLGEVGAGKWFAEKCESRLTDTTGFYARPDLCSVGPVEPFMLHLIRKWQVRNCEHELPKTNHHSVFHDILKNWNGDISDEIHALLELHANKVRNVTSPNNDLVFGLGGGLNFCLPFEVCFIALVRDQQGLSVPRMDHPIMQCPLAAKPQQPCRSGFDPLIQLVIDRCDELGVNLKLPWEIENQSRPACDWQLRWAP